jgi:hypothetical protein
MVNSQLILQNTNASAFLAVDLVSTKIAANRVRLAKHKVTHCI